MNIKEITLQNFRCFAKNTFAIKAPYVLIQGPNGSGKTSLLEALYYAAYLRSWKSAAPRELIAFNTSSFFIRLIVEQSSIDQKSIDQGGQELSIGFSPQKRVVTLDQVPIRSFRELVALYRIIQITYDDIHIMSGSPECRRMFIDTALAIHSLHYLQLLRQYTTIVEQRNALLKQAYHRSLDSSLYWQWTEQLWYRGKAIMEQRINFLATLSTCITDLGKQYDALCGEPGFAQTITMHYEPKRVWEESFDQFMQKNTTLPHEETKIGRSLIGPHLDDVGIYTNMVRARTYASRGQQKLITMFIKLAQIQNLLKNGYRPIVLIDDFITDFDEEKIEILLLLLKALNVQIFFTVPSARSDKHQNQTNLSGTQACVLRVLGNESTQVITL